VSYGTTKHHPPVTLWLFSRPGGGKFFARRPVAAALCRVERVNYQLFRNRAKTGPTLRQLPGADPAKDQTSVESIAAALDAAAHAAVERS
jgi:hypothetical protein